MPLIERKFWLVWREGSLSTRFQHQSRESACIEAERLAREHGGKFYVLEAQAVVESPIPPLTWTTLEEIPF